MSATKPASFLRRVLTGRIAKLTVIVGVGTFAFEKYEHIYQKHFFKQKMLLCFE